MLLLKKLHVRENETLPLKLQKEVQPQGEESALLPVRKAALREKLLREKLPLREAALREKLLREKLLREKAALRERHLRERLPLRNEEGNQSFRLKNLFLFFNYY
uniref:Uncharacterized protein n=1 Tax=uncultured marine thaumarchaeote SAT1000_31_A02 TaxID=1456404 RepID=A0A075ICI9_9ARCH|nr:hypothetical protein [uncultured marine thaumarchaeote SAT1000_31_A02]